jgi:parallel beta-helix repeat protein
MTWTVNYNNITDNLISNTTLLRYYGSIDIGKSRGDYVTGNVIISNDVGIHLESVYNSTFFHNTLISNRIQVDIADLDQGTSKNTWDDGYPSGGNYWSDYNGTDANHDGIGDSPYVINSLNVDRYPLMSISKVTPPNRSDNISSVPVPSESQNSTDGTGNATIPSTIKKLDTDGRKPAVPKETNDSGTNPVNAELKPEPPPNLLTVLVVAGILVAPLMVTIYLAKKNTSQDRLKPQNVANG